MKTDGGPAYPGMSLRDYFAGQALAGWIANPEEVSPNKCETIPEMGARISYLYADAMLAERVKP